MSYSRLLLVVLLIIVIVAPVSVSGAVFLADDEGISANEAIDDDVFVASDTVRLNEAIHGDVFVVGQVVEVSGDVDEDVFAAGESVDISSQVGDDILAAGAAISITSPTVDDLFAAGSTISVSPETTVTGTTYITGATLELAGSYRKNLYLQGDDVTIRSGTTIDGDLNTYGSAEPTIQEGVTIRGKHEHHPAAEFTSPTTRDRVISWLTSVATWFIAALLLLLVFPSLTRQIVGLSQQRPGKAVGVGVVWILLLIPAAIILAITIIGIPLMAILLLVSILVFVVGFAYANILLGALIMQRFVPNQPLSWQHVLLGTVLFKTLPFIPVLGSLAALCLTIWAIGAVGLTFWRLLRPDPAATIA